LVAFSILSKNKQSVVVTIANLSLIAIFNRCLGEAASIFVNDFPLELSFFQGKDKRTRTFFFYNPVFSQEF